MCGINSLLYNSETSKGGEKGRWREGRKERRENEMKRKSEETKGGWDKGGRVE